MQRRHRSRAFRIKTESVAMPAGEGIHWPWKGLSSLLPSLPARVVVVGPSAAGFASDDPMEIVVVVDDRNRPSLEPQLAEIAATASELVSSLRPRSASCRPSSGHARRQTMTQIPTTTSGWRWMRLRKFAVATPVLIPRMR